MVARYLSAHKIGDQKILGLHIYAGIRHHACVPAGAAGTSMNPCMIT